LHEMEYFKLGADYMQRFPDIIAAITKENLLEAASRYLVSNAAVQVTVGPEKAD